MTDLFLLILGAVVGALADRVNDISYRVFVPDCVDLPVLQSPDMSLPAPA